MFATRGGRESSSGPSPTSGCTNVKYATHVTQNRRPNVSPSPRFAASSARSHHQPVATASDARTPITAWLKRGARESITASSR